MGPIYRDHEPANLKPLLESCGVERIVVVQAAETLAETLFTLGLAARNPWIGGVVGWVDPGSPSVEEEVAALAAWPRLKGFRPVRDDNRSIAWMLDGRLERGYRTIQQAGLSLDVLVQNPDEIPLVTWLARRHLSLTFVLDHCGKPDVAGGRYDPWARDIAELAACPNVVCKFSGLPNRMAPGADRSVLKPYAEHVLTCFGPERTMWGSDWPPLLLADDYLGWWETAQELLAGLDAAAREAVLGGTAAEVYRLEETG